MTRRSPSLQNVDPSTFVDVDDGVLAPKERRAFRSRKDAILRYARGESVALIEEQTGLWRRQLYDLLKRCLATHSDGRAYGFRGLVRYARIAGYDRVTPVRTTQGGAAGVFGRLLQDYPQLRKWIDEQIQGRELKLRQIHSNDALRTQLIGLTPLHTRFLRQCRASGIGPHEYPFTARRMAIRCLSAYAKAQLLARFSAAARAAGAERLKGLPPPGADAIRAVKAPLEVVELDGHRLDVRLKIVVRDPLGFEQSFEIERVWLLVVLDVYSRAVLGYHVALASEYSRYDVIRAVERSIEPHRDVQFTLPGVGYGLAGGFPSAKFPELGYVTWNRIKLDGARANLAADVRYALTEFLGCSVEIGAPRQPDERPYIERFFGTIASSMSSRLPGYTGSHPRDLRKALSVPGGNLRLFVSLEEIEELIEAALGAYNAMPHSGLNGRTPLEAISHGVRDQAMMLNWLPESKRRTLCLMQEPRRARVRGYLAQGQRGHVNFHGVRYTNVALASTGAMIGTVVRLYYNSQDLRTVRAFAADGTDLGELRAQGAWGIVAHDLKLRQEILRQRGQRRMASNLTLEFLDRFVESKHAQARTGRRAASDLARTLRTMKPKRESQPTAPVPPPPNLPPAAAPEVRPVVPASLTTISLRTSNADALPASTAKVQPQRLSIGTGYVIDADRLAALR